MSADNGIFILRLKDAFIVKETTASMLDDLFYNEKLMIQENKITPNGIKNVFSNYISKKNNYNDAIKSASRAILQTQTEYGIQFVNATEYSYSEVFR